MRASPRALMVGCACVAMLLLVWTGSCDGDTGSNNNNQQQNNNNANDNNAVADGGVDANVQQDAQVQQDAAVQQDAFVQQDAGPTATVLDSTHSGWGLLTWQNKDCFRSGCHVQSSLSNPPHPPGLERWECGACHGGNGSCDPNGGTKTDHTAADNCMSACHGSHHGFNTNAACVGCHNSPLGGTPDCSP